jgi:hypothetical protein
MESYMAFEFVAERDAETVRIRHNSSLIAVAKARVWASEGWSVTIVMDDQETPSLFQEFPAALGH